MSFQQVIRKWGFSSLCKYPSLLDPAWSPTSAAVSAWPSLPCIPDSSQLCSGFLSLHNTDHILTMEFIFIFFFLFEVVVSLTTIYFPKNRVFILLFNFSHESHIQYQGSIAYIWDAAAASQDTSDLPGLQKKQGRSIPRAECPWTFGSRMFSWGNNVLWIETAFLCIFSVWHYI